MNFDWFVNLYSRDDHRFSLLHWASREGRTNIVDMLIQRGARINATNMGDDTALHLAASHGHRDIVVMVGTLQDHSYTRTSCLALKILPDAPLCLNQNISLIMFTSKLIAY